MQTSPICSKKQTLTMSGWLNVTNKEGKQFCVKGGCGDYTKGVLDCIHHVKRDFWFANKATVKHIYNTIDVGCNTSQGHSFLFNGLTFDTLIMYIQKVKQCNVSCYNFLLILVLIDYIDFLLYSFFLLIPSCTLQVLVEQVFTHTEGSNQHQYLVILHIYSQNTIKEPTSIT